MWIRLHLQINQLHSNTVTCECNFNFSSDKIPSLNFTEESSSTHNIFTMQCSSNTFKWTNLSSNPGFWTSSVMIVGQVAIVGMFIKNGLSALTLLASPTEKEECPLQEEFDNKRKGFSSSHHKWNWPILRERDIKKE